MTDVGNIFFCSKIATDSWSRCVLIKANDKEKPTIKNKNYVLMGEKCKNGGSFLGFKPPKMNQVTFESDHLVEGEDLKSYSNILSLNNCISLCQITQKCEAYEYLSENSSDDWNKNICHLKYRVTGLKPSNKPNVISGFAPYICQTSTMPGNEAIGQNIASIKSLGLQDCILKCQQTRNCVGFSFSNKMRSCFVKASIEYFREAEGFTSGRACFHPPTYNISNNMKLLASAKENVPGRVDHESFLNFHVIKLPNL